MATSELVIPPGYGVLSASFTCEGAPRTLAITCGFRATGVQDPTVNVNAWKTCLTGSGNVFNPSNMSDQYTLVAMYCLENVSGVMYSHSDNTSFAGILNNDPSPVNTSVVVSKIVAPAGRRYRGHMSWPPCYANESSISPAGVIDSTVRGELSVLATGLFDDMVAADIPPYLLHNSIDGGAVPAPTQITAFLVRAQIGTSRHRMKRF